MIWFLGVVVFLFGSIAGSFLNVCIYRLPRQESIVYPRSHCPHCQRAVCWYDNIPLFSYLILRGKCRHCRGMISFRYFLVESITAILFLTLYIKSLPVVSLVFLFQAALASTLVVATFIDFDHRIIPDVITYPGIAIGLIVSILYPPLHEWNNPWSAGGPAFNSGMDSLLGILLGGGFLYFAGFLGELFYKKEAMGGGDIKFIAMIGSFIGWRMVLLTIFFSAFLGSIVGIIIKLKKKESYIPYGPYISMGTIIAIFWGKEIILWYLRLLGR